jgi:hypothetical protein
MRTFLSTVHLDGYFGAHDRAQGAPSARILAVFGRMVTLVVETFGEPDGLIGTDSQAQLAGLA